MFIYIYIQRVCECVPATYHQAHTHILNTYIYTNASKTYEHRYTILISLACAAIGSPTPRVPCRASRQTDTARCWSKGLEDHKGVESCADGGEGLRVDCADCDKHEFAYELSI